MNESAKHSQDEIIKLIEGLFECFRSNTRMLLECQDAIDLNEKSIKQLIDAVMLTVLAEVERAGIEAMQND